MVGRNRVLIVNADDFGRSRAESGAALCVVSTLQRFNHSFFNVVTLFTL